MLDKIVLNSIKNYNVKNILVGLSGGVDSTVLLHILSAIPNLNIRAVYVNHNLSENSTVWGNFCKSFCNDLNIEYHEKIVDCTTNNRESLEAIARDERYKVYKSLLKNNETLVLGQHADDQIETVLLQLLRGTGLNGLSGMAEFNSYENGFILRPFLNSDIDSVTKEMIEKYAIQHNIKHIVDESNFTNDFRRNFLRNEIIPSLKEEFGNINKSIQRTAKNCAEVNKYVNKNTLNLEGNIFNINSLKGLSDFEIKSSLQKWLQNNKKQTLDSSKLLQLLKFIKNYKTDSNFCLETKKYVIRHYNYEIYLLEKNYKKEYKKVSSAHSKIPEIKGAKIIFRDDIKENLLFEGKVFNIKKYFNRLRLPLWEREFLPIYVLDREIIAIGNSHISENFKSESYFSFEKK